MHCLFCSRCSYYIVVLKERLFFPLSSFQRLKLDKTIYFNPEDLRTRSASRYFEYQIIPKVVVCLFFAHQKMCFCAKVTKSQV